MKKTMMIALDFPTQMDVNTFLDQFPYPEQLIVKIGMELFYRYGPEAVREIQNKGCSIFLDLKLMDIPNTVYAGMFQLAKLGVDYVTVHTLGGSEMMRAAKRGLVDGSAEANKKVPELLGVTELTSISQTALTKEQNCSLTMNEQVVSLANLAKASGCDGVITSAKELNDLVEQVGDDFDYVVPGIRSRDDASEDQKRVATPEQAREHGASAIVVGRPITQNEHPYRAYQKYDDEWNLKKRVD
ncbi:orotidine-5'-phosphate decarboxylase [Fructilactobacillus fructivorans]|uniref:orotidine-5'-phosphate decarboxylase n=1 Tax=Fructilactobacillus fructivorans TaxID=1614 RepID=UPI0007053A7E|nr:orotidine-5'-phosphate decarboxylase [Fructilactobacillus fructivorans]KRN42268.1 orotidine 5-phosphate decarboxylase [Fructilactobacillus fructivorans]